MLCGEDVCSDAYVCGISHRVLPDSGQGTAKAACRKYTTYDEHSGSFWHHTADTGNDPYA